MSLEETAIYVMLASRPVKILAVYLLPSRPVIVLDLSACFSGGDPILMARDLSAKHLDWNPRPATWDSLLCNYASENACLICGPDTPTTVL
jgi:hypothetical protein